MGPEDLAQVLGSLRLPSNDRVVIGFSGADDAAAVRLNDGKLLLQTVDFFTPIVDDPYVFGQIAAANALSDIYAMGGTPLFALNIVAYPIHDLPKEMLVQILQGGADKAEEANIPIVGGHSIDDKEPKYGLVVSGEIEEQKLITNAGAQPGDSLILTKPLGTGIIATGIKKAVAPQESIDAAIQTMTNLNAFGSELMQKYGVHAATDITGFGLSGHLLEMCRASKISAVIEFDQLTFLPHVRQLVEQGIIPEGTRRNLDYIRPHLQSEDHLTEVEITMVADAQTSGGLLIALPPERAQKFLTELNQQSLVKGFEIGTIIPQKEAIIWLK
ncbi:MAG: selenide, water dikinase SelD [Fidelibacterota bacterium]